MGERLQLRRERANRFDPNAIAVIRQATEEHIGDIKRELAADLAPLIDQGERIETVISDITGRGEETSRVNIHLDICGEMRRRYRAGRYEEAREALEKVIELRGDDGPTMELGPRR